MAPKVPSERRKKVMPSRRRLRDDDGEDEISAMSDPDDDSLSEASAITNGDDDAGIEASEASADEEISVPEHGQDKSATAVRSSQALSEDTANVATNGNFKKSADTDVMLNGLKTETSAITDGELQFDKLQEEREPIGQALPEGQRHGNTRQESFAERNRREHQEYLKQRDANPAFVPNRGGFFLHDNRNSPSASSNLRYTNRGRGRGPFNGAQAGRGAAINEPTEKQWAHDLHEAVTKHDQQAPVPTARQQDSRPSVALPTGPNRSFSTSVVVGRVPVHINLPGMSKRISIANVVRKQHTLLPQHRPPLRRDKPVRISLPDIAPRYIFPSIERSFIFIPRAMRPNQNYQRGRGRGSFHGSRRTSVFGGSGYTASAAMSRRSSIGQITPRDGVRSPAVSVMSGNALPEQRVGRPVVRMPSVPPQTTNGPPAMMQPINSVTRESSQQALPMHQPRPQKNVSVADIESPASFTFNQIPQQEEQPFHQQVPRHVGTQSYSEGPHSRRPSFPQMQDSAPLNQIPDRAIYAQPFMPYPIYQAPAFYPVFYPPMGTDPAMFNGSMPQPMLPTTFLPGPAQPLPTQPGLHNQTNDTGVQGNMVAHESNGMVYYYDPATLPGGPQAAPMPHLQAPPNNGMMGMAAMTPPAQFYYPPVPGMFYAPR